MCVAVVKPHEKCRDAGPAKRDDRNGDEKSSASAHFRLPSSLVIDSNATAIASKAAHAMPQHASSRPELASQRIPLAAAAATAIPQDARRNSLAKDSNALRLK